MPEGAPPSLAPMRPHNLQRPRIHQLVALHRPQLYKRLLVQQLPVHKQDRKWRPLIQTRMMLWKVSCRTIHSGKCLLLKCDEAQIKDVLQTLYQTMVQVTTYDQAGRPSKDVLENSA